jgi:hypothetical protein
MPDDLNTRRSKCQTISLPGECTQPGKDQGEIPSPDGAHLPAFHKDLDLGSASAFSRPSHDLELLQSDYQGAGEGHFTMQPHMATRLTMGKRFLRGQVTRAVRAMQSTAAMRAS